MLDRRWIEFGHVRVEVVILAMAMAMWPVFLLVNTNVAAASKRHRCGSAIATSKPDIPTHGGVFRTRDSVVFDK